MTRRLLILTVVSVLSSLPADAATPVRSVRDLVHMCEMPTASPPYAVCLGYISAVGDILKFLGAGTEPHAAKPIGICGSPTYGEMVETFLHWAKANHKHWEDHRTEGVMQALEERWPCS